MKSLANFFYSLGRLFRSQKRGSSLLFTRDNIRIDPDIDYGGDEIVAYVEVWFDPEAKFGTKLRDDEYVNMYACLSPYTEGLRVDYIIYRYDGRPDEQHTYAGLTQGEKDLIREMIEEVCLKETGMSVDGAWFSFANEDCFSSFGR